MNNRGYCRHNNTVRVRRGGGGKGSRIMPAYANFIGTVNYFSRNVTVELQYDGLVETKSPLHRTLVFARAKVNYGKMYGTELRYQEIHY